MGDRAEASTGATTVSDAFDGLRSAVADGVPANSAGIYDTVKASERSGGLARVCGLMSKHAKRQAVIYANRSAGRTDVRWTCPKATGLLLRRAGQAKDLERSMRVAVIGVNVDGNRATATIRFGGRKGRLSTIPLVKEGGEWKLGTAPEAGI